jgi:hypothetical protein
VADRILELAPRATRFADFYVHYPWSCGGPDLIFEHTRVADRIFWILCYTMHVRVADRFFEHTRVADRIFVLDFCSTRIPLAGFEIKEAAYRVSIGILEDDRRQPTVDRTNLNAFRATRRRS